MKPGKRSGKFRQLLRSKCYTVGMVTREDEDYFLNPPPGSAAASAVEFGIDLTLTLENLRLTPEERIRKLDDFIAVVTEMKASARIRSVGDVVVTQSD